MQKLQRLPPGLGSICLFWSRSIFCTKYSVIDQSQCLEESNPGIRGACSDIHPSLLRLYVNLLHRSCILARVAEAPVYLRCVYHL